MILITFDNQGPEFLRIPGQLKTALGSGRVRSGRLVRLFKVKHCRRSRVRANSGAETPVDENTDGAIHGTCRLKASQPIPKSMEVDSEHTSEAPPGFEVATMCDRPSRKFRIAPTKQST